MHFSHIPLAVMTDSYKTTHPSIYPEAQRMVAYGEMRQAYDKDPSDNRMVAYGIRYMYVSLGYCDIPIIHKGFRFLRLLFYRMCALLLVLFCVISCSLIHIMTWHDTAENRIENYVAKKWTLEDVEQAKVFFKTHNAGFTPFPFPEDLFKKVIVRK